MPRAEPSDAASTPAHALLEVLAYGPDSFEEGTPPTVDAARAYLDRHAVTWLNINRQDPGAAQGLAALLDLHPLAVEDALKPGRRPKVEDHGGYVFVLAQMAELVDARVVTEQLALFIGPRFLVTVQETPGDAFDPVRERLRQGHPQLRGGGPDMLAYALLDALVDSYFPLLEDLGEQLERMEDEILASPGTETLQRVQDVKHQLVHLRRIAWPQRETLAILHHGDMANVRPETRPFFRDVHDHAVSIMDILETYRELTADVTDLYRSSVNQRTNDIMKVLTMIATIFIPLTFVTSVYGMNFDTSLPGNMPELRQPFGYVAVLGSMALIGATLVFWFRRRGWL